MVKYGLGPRARKATVMLVDSQGGEAACLAPRDKRGEQLAVTTDGAELAPVGVEVRDLPLSPNRIKTWLRSGHAA